MSRFSQQHRRGCSLNQDLGKILCYDGISTSPGHLVIYRLLSIIHDVSLLNFLLKKSP